MKKLGLPVLALVALVFASALVWKWRSVKTSTSPSSAPPTAGFQYTVSAVGLVEASTENIAINTTVSGLVMRVYVKAGDHVKVGQPLFSLDDRDLRAEVSARQAALEVARSRVARLEQSPRPEEIPPAQARVREAEAALADAVVQQKLIESVTDRRAVREEDVQRRRVAVKSAEARLEEAKAALALLQAGSWEPDLKIARTESAVPELEAAVSDAIHRLAVLVGTAPGGPPGRASATRPAALSASLLAGLQTPEPIPPVPSEIPIGLPSELLRRRPDIRRAEAEILAEAARLGVARSELYPKFVLSGALGRVGNGGGGLTLGVGNFFALGPSVRLPIFNAGRIRSNIRAQDERVNQALLRYENTIYIAVEEVENSLADYRGHGEQLARLEAAVSSSRRAVDLSRELYTAGLADFLSVLEAQNALYVNEDELAESQAAVVLNLVSLYKALGGGW